MRKLLLILTIFIFTDSIGQSPLKKLIRKSPTAAGCTDSDGQAYIDSSGIVDATYQAALLCFFKGLKDSVALWDSMSTGAGYWLIGQTQDRVKRNIFNLTDVTDTLIFVNSPVFSDTGMVLNGTTQYAKTGWIPSANGILQSSGHLSYYSTTESQKLNEYNIGSLSATTSTMGLGIRRTGDVAFYTFPNGSATQITTSNATSLGFFSGSRTAMNRSDYYKNGVSIANRTTTVSTGGVSTRDIYIGCLNNNGTAAFYTDKTCAFASMGVALTADQERALNFLVEQLMDAMGVGVQ